jgi:surface antigen
MLKQRITIFMSILALIMWHLVPNVQASSGLEPQSEPPIVASLSIVFDSKSSEPIKIIQPKRETFDDVIARIKQAQAEAAIREAAREAAIAEANRIAAIEAARVAESARVKAQQDAFASHTAAYSDTYEWGQCTWFVASRRGVPNHWGNANQWAYNASREGWSVTNQPIVGAIAQTNAGYWGHVAYVVGVGNGRVTVQEMNVYGVGVMDTQDYPTGYFTYLY